MGYTEYMTIRVTKKFIEEGFRNNRNRCPISLACKAMGYNIEVGATYLFHPVSNTIAELPKAAVDFIEKFDRRKDVAPFMFDVEFKKV